MLPFHTAKMSRNFSLTQICCHSKKFHSLKGNLEGRNVDQSKTHDMRFHLLQEEMLREELDMKLRLADMEFKAAESNRRMNNIFLCVLGLLVLAYSSKSEEPKDSDVSKKNKE